MRHGFIFYWSFKANLMDPLQAKIDTIGSELPVVLGWPTTDIRNSTRLDLMRVTRAIEFRASQDDED